MRLRVCRFPNIQWSSLIHPKDGAEIYILSNVLSQNHPSELYWAPSQTVSGITGPMKSIAAVPLLAGLVAAHSGVWNVEVDGNL
jgi:hypothetical protein